MSGVLGLQADFCVVIVRGANQTDFWLIVRKEWDDSEEFAAVGRPTHSLVSEMLAKQSWQPFGERAKTLNAPSILKCIWAAECVRACVVL